LGHEVLNAGIIRFASMKKSKDSNFSRNLAGEVQVARIRVARAESELKSAEAQWRVAKRRRKEAKEAARRVKRQVKLAKANLSEAMQSLADAKTSLLKAGERVAQIRKPARRSARKRLFAKATVSNPPKPVSSGAKMLDEKGPSVNVPQDFLVTPDVGVPLLESQINEAQPQPHLQ
jgi:multidrug efflux pump subunit AcrA (membrane-fusion protein)